MTPLLDKALGIDAEAVGDAYIRATVPNGEAAPPRVANVEEFWGVDEIPPEPSPRLRFLLAALAEGWRPDPDLRPLAYYPAAVFWGVWIREWMDALHPAMWPSEGVDF